MELVGDVEGRNVVIVDDMADTLGTLKKASELVMKMGAKSVRAIATHGVLSGKALDNLETSMLTELMVSDSISTVVDKKFNESLKNREGVMGGQKLNIISCDRILAKSINFISKKKSIHELNIV
jgi:ribose-phosphate pyrophosphokinase